MRTWSIFAKIPVKTWKLKVDCFRICSANYTSKNLKMFNLCSYKKGEVRVRMTVPFPDMQHRNNTCVHISKFAGTDCRLAFLSSLCTSLSLFFRDLGCLFLLAPPWAAFPEERFKPRFLEPIRSFARKKHKTEPAVSDSAFTSHRKKGSI